MHSAFDSSGRHYDQRGNFTGWWDNSTIKAFKAKAECFVDQYHNYTIPGPDGRPLHVNGRLTLGENIADAGGVTAAFQAWKAREAATPSDMLPGLQDFSKEQLFFISYGNWWCGKTRKEAAINRVYTDPHSPNFARILVSLYNQFRWMIDTDFGGRVRWPTRGSSRRASNARRKSPSVNCGDNVYQSTMYNYATRFSPEQSFCFQCHGWDPRAEHVVIV